YQRASSAVTIEPLAGTDCLAATGAVVKIEEPCRRSSRGHAHGKLANAHNVVSVLWYTLVPTSCLAQGRSFKLKEALAGRDKDGFWRGAQGRRNYGGPDASGAG